MKNNRTKIISILLIVLSVILMGVNVYAHSGKTDSRGGHKDNKNKSGLGSYHYHCGGYPAHLHTNGVCPYSSSSSSNKTSTSSSSASSQKTTSTVVTDIIINENLTSMEEGESRRLTVTITPNNATDKSIVWKSSDESIATVSTAGKVVAKKYGTVRITATTSNGKASTIKIDIKKNSQKEYSDIINKQKISNTTTNNKESSNPLAGLLTLGLLGGGSYLGYKKYKKS